MPLLQRRLLVNTVNIPFWLSSVTEVFFYQLETLIERIIELMIKKREFQILASSPTGLTMFFITKFSHLSETARSTPCQNYTLAKKKKKKAPISAVGLPLSKTGSAEFTHYWNKTIILSWSVLVDTFPGSLVPETLKSRTEVWNTSAVCRTSLKARHTYEKLMENM